MVTTRIAFFKENEAGVSEGSISVTGESGRWTDSGRYAPIIKKDGRVYLHNRVAEALNLCGFGPARFERGAVKYGRSRQRRLSSSRRRGRPQARVYPGRRGARRSARIRPRAGSRRRCRLLRLRADRLRLEGGVVISFFTGKTLSGSRWVISFEGGPTAVDPTPATVTGNVPTFYGRQKLRGLTTKQGSELRSMLSHVEDGEVPSLLCDIRRIR